MDFFQRQDKGRRDLSEFRMICQYDYLCRSVCQSTIRSNFNDLTMGYSMLDIDRFYTIKQFVGSELMNAPLGQVTMHRLLAWTNRAAQHQKIDARNIHQKIC